MSSHKRKFVSDNNFGQNRQKKFDDDQDSSDSSQKNQHKFNFSIDFSEGYQENGHKKLDNEDSSGGYQQNRHKKFDNEDSSGNYQQNRHKKFDNNRNSSEGYQPNSHRKFDNNEDSSGGYQQNRHNKFDNENSSGGYQQNRYKKFDNYQDSSEGYQQNRHRKYDNNEDSSGGYRPNRHQNYGNNSYENNQDPSEFIQIPKPEKPRKYSVSIAVPASILDATSKKDELRTYVVGQIARAAVIYSIDEIIVYNENSVGKRTQEQNALQMMKSLLEYQDLPPYLKKYFFGFDKNLRCVGLLNPLNAAHHLKYFEWCEFREAAILKDPDENKDISYADAGLHKSVTIKKKIKEGLRVTLKFESTPPKDVYDEDAPLYAEAVSPDTPRTSGGFYWGYSVRLAETFSEIVTGCKYPEGYDLIIGTSDKGKDEKTVEYPQFTHALIVFGGVNGLEPAIMADPEIKRKRPTSLFHYYVNTCSNQQVRTIRTEEAVMISLCTMYEKLCAKGIN